MRIAFDQFLRTPFQVLVELAVIWICVFLVFRFLLGTRGAGIMRGLVIVMVVVTIMVRAAVNSDQFQRLGFIASALIGTLATFLIVVFQPELRQAMVRLSELAVRRNKRRMQVPDEVAAAAEYLSRSQFGALVVIERHVRLGGLIEAGTTIDSLVSAELLESIFYPNGPLHDLAVVIRGERIVAAKVQLPLADSSAITDELGSRHRAAVGITIESDCLVVIVSEESGSIRMAERGQLSAPIPREEFRDRLAERLNASPAAIDEVLEEPVGGEPTSAPSAPGPDVPEPASAAPLASDGTRGT